MKNELLRTTADTQKRIEYKKRKKRMQQEIFRLENDLRRAAEGQSNDDPHGRQSPQAASESATGAMPDFLIIGAKKCGTTFLYDLLSRHPYVEPAAKKELHYFDILADEESTEWYRRCFPPPRWKEGRRTITGEATPEYLSYPPASRRMAKVIPQARLIALLRNPVDRAYSDYQQVVRKGRETRTFKEAIGMEEARPPVRGAATSKRKDLAGPDSASRGYLAKGIYVDQLLRWSRFFGDEQMLVLKSEDFFERPAHTLGVVLDFLELPQWEPPAWEVRNKGDYEQKMDPQVRRWLEEYFEAHNRRLYEYLGVDFGW